VAVWNPVPVKNNASIPVVFVKNPRVPNFAGSGVEILDPGESVGVSVPAEGGEEHPDVEGGHGDSHHGAHAAQDGAVVVAEHLEVPRVFGARAVFVGGEAVAPDPRVDAARVDAHVVGSLSRDAPVLGLDVRGRRLGVFEPHAHRVARDSVKCAQRHVSSLD